MEIRDPVHGNIVLSDQETAVIDSPEFQRLRAIKQLGFAEVSFPGATHNRFLHSIGVCHIAGMVFDHIFRSLTFSSARTKARLRQTVRLGALLHDIGHGPLSHTIEDVMPPLADLKIAIYENKTVPPPVNQRSSHEDYTIKYLTDSPLTAVLRQQFPDLEPIHVACLIDRGLNAPDDFFFEQGIDFRPILSQIVSSELDADRMDYLERDSYFCGTNYGKVDLQWLIANLTYHQMEGRNYLGLNRRALYTFDDFLISRHHMHLMVYFHHKSIIFEEMLNLYLASPDCTFSIPADINEYTKYSDYRLYEHLSMSNNSWAQRIAKRQPYRMLVELHSTAENSRSEKMQVALQNNGISTIASSSKTRLSKYHSITPDQHAPQIYVVDQYDKWDQPIPIDQSTEIFEKYEKTRIIDRLYVSPQDYAAADKVLRGQRI